MANTTGKKFGGRKKGSHNKSKQQLLDLIRAEVGEAEYHPVVEMARQAKRMKDTLETGEFPQEGELTKRDMESIMQTGLREVSRYVAPQLKAVEVSGSDGGALEVVVRKFTSAD